MRNMNVSVAGETHEERCDKCGMNGECICISADGGDRHMSFVVKINLCQTCFSKVFKRFKKGE